MKKLTIVNCTLLAIIITSNGWSQGVKTNSVSANSIKLQSNSGKIFYMSINPSGQIGAIEDKLTPLYIQADEGTYYLIQINDGGQIGTVLQKNKPSVGRIFSLKNPLKLRSSNGSFWKVGINHNQLHYTEIKR